MAIVIQAGHVNIGQNCDEALRGQTGANGEVEYVAEIAGIVAGALQAHGPTCIVADANFNCSQDAKLDYQAVVALHCDGRSSSGFAVGVGNPTTDGAAAQSEKLASSLRSAYATANSALPDISSQFTSDPNITEYYLFNALSQATPFALVELGAIASADGGSGPDRDYLLSHVHEVASGIVNGILQFMGIGPAAVVASSQPGAAPASEPAPAEVPTTSAGSSQPAEQPAPAPADPTRAALKEQLQSVLQNMDGLSSALQKLLELL